MRIATVREFRDHATGLLRSKAPILVTRRGRLAGVFFPWPEESLPVEFKKELFSVLSSALGRELKRRKESEEEVQADFESWRKARRAPRG
ncbi:MAG: hypothetical protein K6T61_14555 [Bryobacteraceae bacterium]|nr:hypothetical protein [Bryobacteraceae bacterium]